jgi:hypothetical protein
MKRIRCYVALAAGIMAFFGWSAFNPQKAVASDDPSGTFLTTITVANTGAFSSRSVITLHADHSVAVVDSGQGGPANLFSSQQGVWERDSGGVLQARTLDFSFPSAGIARVDYKFNADVPANQVAGTITLTVFPLTGNPLDGGGTVVGTFNFTGTRVTAP